MPQPDHISALPVADPETLTTAPADDRQGDRAGLRVAGLGDEEIFDLADTVAFFNMSNRMASGLDIVPNREYHGWDR
jgi:alkylhydroperoxidase family enzyme